MGQQFDYKEKIYDDALLEFALSDSDEHQTVIIELDLVEPEVEFQSVKRGGVSVNVPVKVRSKSIDQKEETEKKAAETQEYLSSVLDKPAKWLWAAHSFVATVTPSQIREIAKSPFIKTFHPNIQYQK